MFDFSQVPSLTTGNAKLDTIAQASALGISLAATLVGIFGKKKPSKKAPARKVTHATARPKVVVTDEAIDELGGRR